MNRLPVASALTLGALTVVLAGCGGGSSTPSTQPAPRVSPAALDTSSASCGTSALPAGYVLDKAHSGAITAHTYSASADVQAALEYDQLSSGTRDVYLHRQGGAKSAVDSVASCVTLSFPSTDTSGRFFGSYQQLRSQAKPIVTPLSAPKVNGVTGAVAYFEKEQSYRGYGIKSTNVIEVAGLHGTTLDIVSISGAKPQQRLATNLLKATVTQS